MKTFLDLGHPKNLIDCFLFEGLRLLKMSNSCIFIRNFLSNPVDRHSSQARRDRRNTDRHQMSGSSIYTGTTQHDVSYVIQKISSAIIAERLTTVVYMHPGMLTPCYTRRARKVTACDLSMHQPYKIILENNNNIYFGETMRKLGLHIISCTNIKFLSVLSVAATQEI